MPNLKRPTTRKTYHVLVNPKPHVRHGSGDSGCRFNVERIHIGKDWESGVVDFGTCNKLKVKLYLLWLWLRGYRKDRRKW